MPGRAIARAAYETTLTCIRGDWEDRLPKIRIPLADDGPDVVLPLQFVLDQTTSMGQRLNYEQPCLPPLAAEHQAWANQLTRGGAACLVLMRASRFA